MNMKKSDFDFQSAKCNLRDSRMRYVDEYSYIRATPKLFESEIFRFVRVTAPHR